MAKFRTKFVASFLVVSILTGSISGVMTQNNMKIVYAQSQALSNATAKINHLTNSMQKNYLGLKNQATWETYVKEAEGINIKNTKVRS